MSLVDTFAMGLRPEDLGVAYTTLHPSSSVKRMAIEHDDVFPDFVCPECGCDLPEDWANFTSHTEDGVFVNLLAPLHPGQKDIFCIMDRDLLVSRAVRRMFIRA